MAMYNFHCVLIAAAILFDLGFSIYCLRIYRRTGEGVQLLMLIGSSAVTVALVTYLIYFNESLTVLHSMWAFGCARCGCDLRGTGQNVCHECGAECRPPHPV